MEIKPRWISVREYTKLKGLRTPQVVYNWIAKNKLKKDVEWREIEVTKKKLEVWYE